MVRLGLFKDGFAISEAIKLFIKSEKDFRLRFEATRIGEIVYLLDRNPIDLLIVSGTSANHLLFETIRRKFKHQQILVIGHPLELDLKAYKLFQIKGPIQLNKVSIDELYSLIRNEARSTTDTKPNAPGKKVSRFVRNEKTILVNARKLLSKREREVIDMLMQGVSRKRIAEKLHRDLTTIHKHVNNSLHKTGCHKLEDLFEKITQFENKQESS